MKQSRHRSKHTKKAFSNILVDVENRKQKKRSCFLGLVCEKWQQKGITNWSALLKPHGGNKAKQWPFNNHNKDSSSLFWYQIGSQEKTSILILWKTHTKTRACISSSLYVSCNFLQQPIQTYPLSCLKNVLCGNMAGFKSLSTNHLQNLYSCLLEERWSQEHIEVV